MIFGEEDLRADGCPCCSDSFEWFMQKVCDLVERGDSLLRDAVEEAAASCARDKGPGDASDDARALYVALCEFAREVRAHQESPCPLEALRVLLSYEDRPEEVPELVEWTLPVLPGPGETLIIAGRVLRVMQRVWSRDESAVKLLVRAG